jgi:hypothetical protein
MQRHRRAAARCASGLLTCVLCGFVALALLFSASEAMSQSAGQPAAAPDNGNPFARLFRLPSTAAPQAAPEAQPVQRVRKPRISKVKKRPKPAAAQQAASAQQRVPPPAEEPAAPQPVEQVNEPAWPNAEASAGGTTMITPLAVKTVREQLEPEPETPTVSENELSDIDRAAEPVLAEKETADSLATTDGSGAIETGAAERPRVLAMGDTMKAMMQSAWAEPVLLMIAGALAGLAASRLFT